MKFKIPEAEAVVRLEALLEEWEHINKKNDRINTIIFDKEITDGTRDLLKEEDIDEYIKEMTPNYSKKKLEYLSDLWRNYDYYEYDSQVTMLQHLMDKMDSWYTSVKDELAMICADDSWVNELSYYNILSADEIKNNLDWNNKRKIFDAYMAYLSVLIKGSSGIYNFRGISIDMNNGEISYGNEVWRINGTLPHYFLEVLIQNIGNVVSYKDIGDYLDQKGNATYKDSPDNVRSKVCGNFTGNLREKLGVPKDVISALILANNGYSINRSIFARR